MTIATAIYLVVVLGGIISLNVWYARLPSEQRDAEEARRFLGEW